ncbi:hypothetical protein BH11PSE12_BH11PSE12_01110 [soil metagenome]
MQIKIAKILGGTETPAGDGITGAQRCVLLLEDGSKKAAVVKRGPIGQVAAEAFSALLLRQWGLTVPEPFLIDESGELAFASADNGYPNLKQSLALDGLPEGPARNAAIQVAMAIACGLPSTSLATACDEAIDNRDRNLGNILWDGTTEAWIDHAFALGEGRALQDENKLCVMAIATGDDERLQRAAIAQALLLERDKPKVIESALSCSPIPPQDLATYVADRLTSLGNRLVARFPSSVDLLSGL